MNMQPPLFRLVCSGCSCGSAASFAPSWPKRAWWRAALRQGAYPAAPPGEARFFQSRPLPPPRIRAVMACFLPLCRRIGSDAEERSRPSAHSLPRQLCRSARFAFQRLPNSSLLGGATPAPQKAVLCLGWTAATEPCPHWHSAWPFCHGPSSSTRIKLTGSPTRP